MTSRERGDPIRIASGPDDPDRIARLGEDDAPFIGVGVIGGGRREKPAVYHDEVDEDGDLIMVYADTERAPSDGAEKAGEHGV